MELDLSNDYPGTYFQGPYPVAIAVSAMVISVPAWIGCACLRRARPAR